MRRVRPPPPPLQEKMLQKYEKRNKNKIQKNYEIVQFESVLLCIYDIINFSTNFLLKKKKKLRIFSKKG